MTSSLHATFDSTHRFLVKLQHFSSRFEAESKTHMTTTSGSDCAAFSRCEMTVIGPIKLLTWNIFTNVFPTQTHALRVKPHPKHHRTTLLPTQTTFELFALTTVKPQLHLFWYHQRSQTVTKHWKLAMVKLLFGSTYNLFLIEMKF